MKFTVEKELLLTALGRCVSVTTEVKPMFPMHSNVYLATNRKTLMLCATDGYRSVSVEIDVNADGVGSICLPAKDLFERVKAMPEGTVAISVEGTTATIRTVGSSRRFTMHGAPGEQFSSIPEPSKTDAKLVTTTHSLAGPLAAVHHSISKDTTKANINSMLMEADQNGMRVVGLDGYSLTTVLTGSEPHGEKWLIPLAAVNDLRRYCDTKTDQEVTLTRDRDTIFAAFPGFTFSAQMAAGTFPDWDEYVAKTKNEREVILGRRDLIDALKAVALSSKDSSGCVRFTFKKGTLALQAKSASAGEASEEMDIEYGGDTFEIGFGYQIVLDALNSLAAEQIVLGTSESNKPATLRVVGSDAYVSLITPRIL